MERRFDTVYVTANFVGRRMNVVDMKEKKKPSAKQMANPNSRSWKVSDGMHDSAQLSSALDAGVPPLSSSTGLY